MKKKVWSSVFSVTMVFQMLFSWIGVGAAPAEAPTIYADDPAIRFFGRTYVDSGNPHTRYFNWTDAGFTFSFTGTTVSAKLITNASSADYAPIVGIFVDGKEQPADCHKVKIPASGTYTLVSDLPAGEHIIKVVKLTEAQHSTLALEALQLPEGSTFGSAPVSENKLKIEFLGDSITCGAALLEEPPETGHTEFEDGWQTYAAVAARELNADFHVLSATCSSMYGNAYGIPNISDLYDYVDGYNNKELLWNTDDRTAFTPDVVVINLGTNDTSIGVGSSDSQANDAFVQKYAGFLAKLRDYYPQAAIVCTIGLMTAAPAPFIQKAVALTGDPNIYFHEEPSGDDGHPNADSHYRAGIALAKKITSILPVDVEPDTVFKLSHYTNQLKEIILNNPDPKIYQSTASAVSPWCAQLKNNQGGSWETMDRVVRDSLTYPYIQICDEQNSSNWYYPGAEFYIGENNTGRDATKLTPLKSTTLYGGIDYSVAWAFTVPAAGIYDFSRSPDADSEHTPLTDTFACEAAGQEVGVRITVDGIKVWPEGKEYETITQTATVKIPTIPGLMLNKGQVLRIEARGLTADDVHASDQRITASGCMTYRSPLPMDHEPPVFEEGSILLDKNGKDFLTISWPEAADAGTVVPTYRVYIQETPFTGTPVGSFYAAGSDTTATLTRLEPDTDYYIAIEARDLTGNSAILQGGPFRTEALTAEDLREYTLPAFYDTISKVVDGKTGVDITDWNCPTTLSPWSAQIRTGDGDWSEATFGHMTADRHFLTNLNNWWYPGAEMYKNLATGKFWFALSSENRGGGSPAISSAWAFTAPHEGVYAFTKLPIGLSDWAAYTEKFAKDADYPGGSEEAVRLRITVNGEKIWPENAEYILLSKENGVDVPTIGGLNLAKGDVLRIEATADSENADAGTHRIYAGGQMISVLAPVLKLTASHQEIQLGEPVTFTATLSGRYGGNELQTIVFKSGDNILGTALTDAEGKAVYTWQAADVNVHTITAHIVEDTFNLASTSKGVTCTVTSNGQTPPSILHPGAKTYGDAPFQLFASGGESTGAYQFHSDHPEVLSVSSNGMATITGAGKATVFVKKLGDSQYDDSPETSCVIEIAPKSLALSVSISNKPYDGTTEAEIEKTVLTGLLDGDDVSLQTPYPFAQFSQATPAENIPVLFNSPFILTGSRAPHYILTQPQATGSILPGWTPERNAHYTISVPDGSNGWYIQTPFVITGKEGYQVSQTNTADLSTWKDCLSYTAETAEGEAAFYVRNIHTGEISSIKLENYRIDHSIPTGKIHLTSHSWQEFHPEVTFDLFFKESHHWTIEAADAISGIASIAYQKVTDADAYREDGPWTQGASLTIIPGEAYMLYARITDEAGNTTVINSSGCVVYTDSTLREESSFFDPNNPQDLQIPLSLNGNTVRDVLLGTIPLQEGVDYIIAGDILQLRKEYLAQVVQGAVSFTIRFDPLGQPYQEAEGNDSPRSQAFRVVERTHASPEDPTLPVSPAPSEPPKKPEVPQTGVGSVSRSAFLLLGISASILLLLNWRREQKS